MEEDRTAQEAQPVQDDQKVALVPNQKIMLAKTSVEQLAEMSKQLKTMSTPELVTVVAIGKMLGKFVDLAKKELVDNKDLSGRFFAEGVKTDEKGHRYLYGVDGTELKAEKRVSVSLDTEVALQVLDEHGLTSVAVQKVTALAMLPDAAVVGVQMAIAAFTALLEADLDMPMELYTQAMSAMQGLMQMLSTRQVVSEAKLEALVALEQISTEEIGKMTHAEVTYAIKA